MAKWLYVWFEGSSLYPWCHYLCVLGQATSCCPHPNVQIRDFQQEGKTFRSELLYKKYFLKMVTPGGQNHSHSRSICLVPSPPLMKPLTNTLYIFAGKLVYCGEMFGGNLQLSSFHWGVGSCYAPCYLMLKKLEFIADTDQWLAYWNGGFFASYRCYADPDA